MNMKSRIKLVKRFTRGGKQPDYDPDNPYHYHDADGRKIVVSEADYEAFKDDPTFRDVKAAIDAERAAYSQPEYEVNPDFVRDLRNTYIANMGDKYQNYRNFASELPLGYNFTDEGIIIAPDGTAYVQEGYKESPRFIYNSNAPMQITIHKGKPVLEKTVTYYPINMEKRVKSPLPVSEVMDVAAKREKNIADYIKHNSYKQMMYATPYIINHADGSVFVYGNNKALSSDVISKHGNWYEFENSFNNIVDEAEQYSTNNLITKQELLESLANKPRVYLEPIQRNPEFWKAGYKQVKPTRQEAEKKAVISIGPLEKVATYATGGQLKRRFATGGLVLPDYDPDNPYHYHDDNGNKVVVSEEDYKAYENNPSFGNIKAKIDEERAAYPGPEYVVDQEFLRALNNAYAQSRAVSNMRNYRNFGHQLPEGYSINEEGIVFDKQGNAYVQGQFNGGQRFTYDRNNPKIFTFNKGKDVERSEVFYPVKMETYVKPSLKVDVVRNIGKEIKQEEKKQKRFLFPWIGDASYVEYPEHLQPKFNSKTGETEYQYGTEDEYNETLKTLKKHSPWRVQAFLDGSKNQKPKTKVVLPSNVNTNKNGNGRTDIYFLDPSKGLNLVQSILSTNTARTPVIVGPTSTTLLKKGGYLGTLISGLNNSYAKGGKLIKKYQGGNSIKTYTVEPLTPVISTPDNTRVVYQTTPMSKEQLQQALLEEKNAEEQRKFEKREARIVKNKAEAKRKEEEKRAKTPPLLREQTATEQIATLFPNNRFVTQNNTGVVYDKTKAQLEEQAANWGRSVGSVATMTPKMVSRNPITAVAIGGLGEMALLSARFPFTNFKQTLGTVGELMSPSTYTELLGASPAVGTAANTALGADIAYHSIKDLPEAAKDFTSNSNLKSGTRLGLDLLGVTPLYSMGKAGVGLVSNATQNTNFARSVALSRNLNKGIKNATKFGDIRVLESYFNNPDKWYRVTETPEVHGIELVGKNVTTEDIQPGTILSDSFRRTVGKNGLVAGTGENEGYWILKPKRLFKRGQAHGNTSQAAKGQKWQGTFAKSGKFPEVMLEGQGNRPTFRGMTPTGEDSRTNFVLLNWEDIPQGARLGFHTGEMPLDNLRWFQKNSDRTFTFKGQVLPEKRIYQTNSHEYIPAVEQAYQEAMKASIKPINFGEYFPRTNQVKHPRFSNFLSDGSEHVVFSDGDKVLKVHFDESNNSLEELLENADNLTRNRNLVSEQMPITLKGYVTNNAGKQPVYHAVFSQEKLTPLTESLDPILMEDLNNRLKLNGWELDKYQGSYINKTLGKKLVDVSPQNIGIKDGKYYIIDGEVFKKGGKLIKNIKAIISKN